MSALAPTLQAFFTDRLDPPAPRQPAHHRRLPRHDAAAARLRRNSRPASSRATLDLDDLDAPLIGAFLEHLERDRGNSVRTRNARLAAIHSLFRYARAPPPRARRADRTRARDPAQALRPSARHLPHRARDRRAARRARPLHLDRPARPRPAAARRPDRPARLRADRPQLRRRPPRHRRPRQLPRQGTQAAHHPAHRRTPSPSCAPGSPSAPANPADPLFPTRRGARLSRDALEHRLAKHAATAAAQLPRRSREKKITPHVLRHTAAMRLLHAGVDTSVIALWLGHESVETTQIYLHADLALKEQSPRPHHTTQQQPRPLPAPRHLLAFLESL